MKCWLALVVLLSSVCAAAKVNDSGRGVPLEVTYCQLVGNPSAYLGKRIVVRAIYGYGFEVKVLKSPTCCPGIEPQLGVAFDPEMDGHSQRLFLKLDKGMGTALAVFVGKLGKVSNVSSQLPSGDRFELSVDRIEKVEKSARWKGSHPTWASIDCAKGQARTVAFGT
jgi:hypothetical protein